jgi:hypothetical protein
MTMKLVLSLTGVTCALAMAAHPAAASTAGRTEFDIIMNGRSVGTHSVTVTTAGTTATANIAINMRGRIGPVTFNYAHRCREVWTGDQLTSASCNDNLNNNPKTIEVTRTGATLSIRGPDFTGTAPGSVMTSSWWRADTARQTRLINSTNGKVEAIRVTNAGAEQVMVAGVAVAATKYRLRGGVSNELWYDAAGRWVKIAFSFAGQRFEYRKRTALAGAPRG